MSPLYLNIQLKKGFPGSNGIGFKSVIQKIS